MFTTTLLRSLNRAHTPPVTAPTSKTGRLRRLGSAIAQLAKRAFPLFLFLVAFLPRAIDLVARSTIWHFRAIEFIQSVSQGNWSDTLPAPHPGVTTMWLAGIAHGLGRIFIPGFEGKTLAQQMAIELLPLALVISLAIVLAYFLLSRIFDRQTAAVSALLLAFDPFHIFISKTLHIDALMSVFTMLSALWMLMYIKQEKQDRLRYVVMSGVFAALALLSKTPALFLFPYLLLCLGLWKLSPLLRALANGTGTSRPRRQDWLKAATDILKVTLIWTLTLAIVCFLLWPSMWVQPQASLAYTFSETTRFADTAHPNPILFMGEPTLKDPGLLFYPVNLAIKTTALTFPGFFLGLAFLFSRKLDRRQRLMLLLVVAFALFFTLQMTLGQKKAARYTLPTFQFVDIVAGVGIVYALRRLATGRRWLCNLAIVLIVLAQAATAIPRHPYYGTHYNGLFGGPKTILGKNVVAGQEQGEGLDIAANYLNRLPMSPLLVASSQIDESFKQYFRGKALPMTDDKVDYLVFARNFVVRGMDAANWQDLWETYRTRQPKLVVEFDGIPYAWVYKVGPAIDETTLTHPLNADVGENFRLLGYDLEPARAQPGETVRLTLYWEATHNPTGDYTVFTHLLDPSGQMYGQRDNQPQSGMYPTYLWDKRERIQDEYELTIAPDAPLGDYQIAVGMYDLQTLERLPIVDQNGTLLPDARILLPGPEVVRPPG